MGAIRYRCCLAVLFTLLCLPALAAEPPLRVVTSIKPLQLLALGVAGDSAGVEVLLDPRFSPHDYQFRPSDRLRLQGADVVFWVGPALETFLRDPLATLPSRVRVEALAAQVSNEEDAHVWLDPDQAAAMARRMAEVMGQLRPELAPQYRANAGRLAAALAREDAQLRTAFAALSHPRPFLVVHDGYGRFEKHYGLHHAAALSDAAERAPGARNVWEIERQFERGDISCVLKEPQYSPKILQTLLQDRAVRVVTIDPLATAVALSPQGFAVFYREFGRAVLSCLTP